MLFLASILILARLLPVSTDFETRPARFKDLPILKPDLNRSLGHANILCNAFPGGSGWCRVLVEFNLEGHQLVLGSPLAFVVLLLLSQGAFARWPAGSRP